MLGGKNCLLFNVKWRTLSIIPIHIGRCGLHSLGVTTSRDAADQESRKYDSRSPASSSTRLEVISPALTRATRYVPSLVRI